MNYSNIDLNSSYESNCNILEPYNFDTLLLEVSCNLPEINAITVKEQATLSIKLKYNEALQILNDNLTNIVNKAIEERKA